MSAELQIQLTRIHEKLQTVVKQYQTLQKENDKLRLALDIVNKDVSQKSAEVELLRQRIEVLKSIKGEMTSDDKQAFEKRLNQYLREIEKCLTLLNE